jgi:hypothetical protein
MYLAGIADSLSPHCMGIGRNAVIQALIYPAGSGVATHTEMPLIERPARPPQLDNVE